MVKTVTFKNYKEEMSGEQPHLGSYGTCNIRDKLMLLYLISIQLGQLSNRVPNNDKNRLREMLFDNCCMVDTYRMKWQKLLMKGRLFSMLVKRLISMPRQSTVPAVPLFDYHLTLAKSIVSCQNLVFKNLLGTFNSSITARNHEVRAIAVNSDANLMAITMNDNTVKLCSLWSKRCLVRLVGHNDTVVSVAIHPSGTAVATGSKDKTVRLWGKNSPCSWTCIAIFGRHTDVVTSLAFHLFLPLLVSGSNDKTAIVWLLDHKLTSAQCVTTIRGHSKCINSVAFHPFLPIVASASDDKTAKMWLLLSDDFSSYEELMTLTGHRDSVTAIEYHSTLPLFVTASYDCSVKVWALSPDGSLARCIATLTEHCNRVLALAFHQSAPILATCGWDRPVKVWVISSDYSSVSCVANLLGHNGPITSVKFDREHLITCGSDRTVKSW